MDNTDRGDKPGQAAGDPRPAAVTSVTTEHFTLQGARSSTISESTGRASVFLQAVSGGLIALGLVATAAKTGVAFYIFGLILLPTLAFVGLGDVPSGAHTRFAWEDVLVLSGDSLIFRLTARQKRTQRIIAAVFAPTGAALAGLGIAADKYVIGYVLLLAAAGALAGACMGLNNARAFTECTPSSLRARTVLGRLREWPWPQVANISVKKVSGRGSTYSAVMVTTTAGRRIRLAAPTSGILTPEEFTASAKQIQDYWRAATAAAGHAERP